MRKAWIAIAIVLAAIIVLVCPGIVGMYFQHTYQRIIADENANENVDIHILQYKRHWFSADATISLDVIHPDFFKVVHALGIPYDDIPHQYIFVQHIQHGPLMYHMVDGVASLVGLAAIQNRMLLTPDVKRLLAHLHVIDPNRFIAKNIDFVALNGSLLKHITLNKVQIISQTSPIQIKQKELDTYVWYNPIKQTIEGELNLTGLNVSDPVNSLKIPEVKLQWNLKQTPAQLWLGNVSLWVSDFIWDENTANLFSIKGFAVSGESSEKNGLMDGTKTIDIERIKTSMQDMGPIHLQFSVEKLNANALATLVDAYQEIMVRGELYQSQLQTKMYSLLPNVFNTQSQLILNGLTIETPEGQLHMTGEMHWTIDEASMPDDLMELLQAANAKIDLRVTKALTEKAIDIASQLPFFNSVGPSLSEVYWDIRQQLYFSQRQNAFLLAGLVDHNLIPENSALDLLLLQKRMTPYVQYANVVKSLFLQKEITRETTYLLDWQYQQVDTPAEQLENLVANNQNAVLKDMHNQLQDWLKQGYIEEDHQDYVASIVQTQGSYKINGHEVQN